MSTTREAGDRGEAMAAEYLRENGYEIAAASARSTSSPGGAIFSAL